MKLFFCFIFFRYAYLLLVTVPFVFVPTHIYATFGGGIPGTFMSWGSGARALGMGKAYVSVADDVTATYWNAAGLTQLNISEVTALQTFLYEGTSYNFVGLAFPSAKTGTFGFSWTILYSGGADKRDINNVSIGTFGTLNTSFGLSYARKVKDKLSVGVTGKFLYEGLDTFYTGNLVIDSGVLWEPVNQVKFGLNLSNILAPRIFGDTDSSLPVIVRLGSSYRPLDDRLILALDIEKRKNIDYHFGIETKIGKILFLRVGQDTQESTGGIGLRTETMNFDYAIGFNNGLLGTTHRISFAFRFGKKEVSLLPAAIIKTPAEMQKEFIDLRTRGLNTYRNGMYKDALVLLTQAKQMDPTDEQVKTLCTRLEMVVPIITAVSGQTKVDQILRRGLNQFLEGADKQSVTTIVYAYTLDTKNITVEKLKAKMEKETGIQVEIKSWLGNLVDQLLYDAELQFRDKKFADVIKMCQEVLLLEPNTAKAYKIMGSAYYAMGLIDKAKESWQKALNIQPDPELRKFINELPK